MTAALEAELSLAADHWGGRRSPLRPRPAAFQSTARRVHARAVPAPAAASPESSRAPRQTRIGTSGCGRGPSVSGASVTGIEALSQASPRPGAPPCQSAGWAGQPASQCRGRGDWRLCARRGGRPAGDRDPSPTPDLQPTGARQAPAGWPSPAGTRGPGFRIISCLSCRLFRNVLFSLQIVVGFPGFFL